ncbi:MAG: hypothetical protein QM489_05090 [Candidatus Izemoplasma sp.]
MSSRTKRIMIIIIIIQLFGFITGGFSMDAIVDLMVWMAILLAIGGIAHYSRSLKNKTEDTQYGKVCPSCSATIGIDETHCPYCGYNYAPEVVCDYCSTLNHTSNTRCTNCNATLH